MLHGFISLQLLCELCGTLFLVSREPDNTNKQTQLTMEEKPGKELNGALDLMYRHNSRILSPEEIIIREQRVKEIRSCLNRLKKKHRLMIELRYSEEKTYEEISRELEISIGMVAAQLFRAREILHSMLRPSDVE